VDACTPIHWNWNIFDQARSLFVVTFEKFQSFLTLNRILQTTERLPGGPWNTGF
jgi:hypothetical protein